MNERTGSPIHQLALISAIRSLFTKDEAIPRVTEILEKTQIMSILSHIINFDSVEEEFYFLKLEALWILINLSMCDTDATRLILLSGYN